MYNIQPRIGVALYERGDTSQTQKLVSKHE
jgi:hypothetical protein